MELPRFSDEIVKLLEKNNFSVSPYDTPWAFGSGGLHLAIKEREKFLGVAEPRRDGAAIEI